MIETIKIVKDNHAGSAIINKSDFDPSKHELFDKPAGDGPSKAEIMAQLKAKGTRFNPAMSKAELSGLLAREGTE